MAKPFCPVREVVRKRAGYTVSSSPEGISTMIALKITALVLGTTVLISTFAPEFDADLLLAIVACVS